ncbi:MAG: V-type ATP synthase subunit E family protein [Candidatus Omnitrophica bacterium]|nr:V-type ATP synthase subunit E family protein [Candidatus Omnitrophota bacterium]
MTEEIKNLIEKINQEGVVAAQEKARQIENEALKKTCNIIEQAKQEAEIIISSAKEKSERAKTKENALLAQAARDVLLSLKKEINVMLDKIILSDVHRGLDHGVLSDILSKMVSSSFEKGKQNIIISLKKEDLHVLEKEFLPKLKEETRQGVTLKSSEEIRGGFTISYDGGKSEYDFTDKALAEYIGTCLKPELNQRLTEIV